MLVKAYRLATIKEIMVYIVLEFDPKKITPTVAEYNGTKTQRHRDINIQ